MSAQTPLTPDNAPYLASDPKVDPIVLQQIAASFPHLRPAVALNPVAYEGLLDWLAKQNAPEVQEALRQRQLQTAPAIRFAPPFTPTKGTNTQVPLSNVPYTGGTPAVGLAPAKGSNLRSPLLWIILILVVILFILIGVVIWAFVGDSGSNNAKETNPATVSSSASKPKSSPASESPANPTPQSQKYPAPTGAIPLRAVTSPSGNIRCDLSQSSVGCSVISRNYSASGYGDCPGGKLFSIIADENSSTMNCNKTYGGGAVLAYGTTAVNGDVACSSSDAGMTCWNMKSGQSFTLSRERWASGSNGPIR